MNGTHSTSSIPFKRHPGSEREKKSLTIKFFLILLIASICLMLTYATLVLYGNQLLKNFYNEKVSTEEDPIKSWLSTVFKNYEHNYLYKIDLSRNSLHSRTKRQLRQMAMNIEPDCRSISPECKTVLKSDELEKMLKQGMDFFLKYMEEQGIVKDKDSKNEKIRKIGLCLKCRSIVRPVPAATDLRVTGRNSPSTIVHEAVVRNDTKIVNGQRINVIVVNKTIIDNDVMSDKIETNSKVRQVPSSNQPVTPPAIMEITKQYAGIEVDHQPQFIPVCFYGSPSTPDTDSTLPYWDGSNNYYLPQNGYSGLPTSSYYNLNNYFQNYPIQNNRQNSDQVVYCFSMPVPSSRQSPSTGNSAFQQPKSNNAAPKSSSILESSTEKGSITNSFKSTQKHGQNQGPWYQHETNQGYDYINCPGGKICEFTDPPGRCVPPWRICDLINDCPNAEDEEGCEPKPQPAQNSKSKSADDNEIAEVNENEVDPTTEPNYTVPSTPKIYHTSTTTEKTYAIIPEMPEQFVCKNIVQTISIEQRCNKVYDCEDASDEENCTCRDYLKWDHSSVICDGHVDCYDGTDEENCGDCRDDQYRCHRSSTCIPRHKLCDQNVDCVFNEDELDCESLTDGNHINFDMDKRPHLNMEGIVTHFSQDAWRPICFNSRTHNESMRLNIGQKFCDYLGFKDVETAEEVLVQTSKLTEKLSSKDNLLNYEYKLKSVVPLQRTDNTCYGLRIRCKPILDRKLNVHARFNPETNKKSYLWPWESSIFVNGKYHCSALLLENDLLLSSSECGEGIEPSKNYTVALFGVASPDLPLPGPYQQVLPILQIKPIKNSDATLFRLKKSINMTRYVQPLYLEKRIFPASKDDTCVAIGVNSKQERKMMFLRPVVDNCPKCHRCYIEKDDTTSCSLKNHTVNWSGYVVCLNDGGWYPAAVFHEKDESCGFGSKQILNSIDYLHAHLYEAIDKKETDIENPSCNGVRCSLGQCIPWDRVCDGIRDCQDGTDESAKHCQKMKDKCQDNIFECKCSKSELRCGNGKCLPKEKFCDGRQDCGDGSDEPETCTCGDYLKLVEPKRVCDGRQHCMDKSDERYQDCLCKDSSFKCYKSKYDGSSPCVPQDFVCDGFSDCPEGEDEAEHVCWAIKTLSDKDPKGKGEVMRRTNGILHPECFPRPIKSHREITNVCMKLGYTSGFLLDSTKISDITYIPRNDFYMFQLNNYTWMSMRPDTSYGIWTKPEQACYKLVVHCFI